jgi:Fe-Mn family superoxide dismutase
MTSDKELIGNFQVEAGEVVSRREVLVMGAMAAAGMAALNGKSARAEGAAAVAASTPAAAAASGPWKAKDFSSLATMATDKKLDGFTGGQIAAHLKLYNGYVGKSNEINGLLQSVDISGANATYAPLRELLLEQSFAQNGVIYHELYFGNLGGKGGEPTGDLRSAIEASWGSNGKFMDYFKAAGKCMRGWVIVGWNTRDNNLHAYGLDMHNMWVPANVIPVVVLDVYEHAYMIDFGIDRGAYLEAFLKNMDWEACNKRLAIARKHPAGADSTT